MNERVKVILDFWFEESSPEDHFKKNNDFDKKIKENFINDYLKAIKNELDDWQDFTESCLALVILLDQFSRNLNRNSSLAFAYDKKTRLIVNEAIDRGDLEKTEIHKMPFLLMPLIHSEDISDHIFADKLRETYLTKHTYHSEIKNSWNLHKDIIKKFHRYPHRNKVLGRESTNKEKEYLLKSKPNW